MANSLSLKTIAEGVETEEQAAFLSRNGADEIQGYLVCHAVAPAEFERFLERGKDEQDTDDPEGHQRS